MRLLPLLAFCALSGVFMACGGGGGDTGSSISNQRVCDSVDGQGLCTENTSELDVSDGEFFVSSELWLKGYDESSFAFRIREAKLVPQDDGVDSYELGPSLFELKEKVGNGSHVLSRKINVDQEKLEADRSYYVEYCLQSSTRDALTMKKESAGGGCAYNLVTIKK